ncbi:hypothetical protein [Planctobacterium marinum]|uniref:DUF2721 domain-containing protein n=1 Tax=Planctobacterium marinum TaxID=1631968 RepID=A0AA48HQG6_9ALTE|nr:hypothetical protein MACH26_16400 [Planctobacterium marinum]
MEFEYFTSIMTPGIALLILSTTMRLGNVRMALTELAKTPGVDMENLESYKLFSNRARFLCRGLRMLNISMLILIPGALGKLVFNGTVPEVTLLIVIADVVFFLFLFLAVFALYKESQLTGKSIIAHTSDIKNAFSK